MKNGERILLLKIISFSLNCLSDVRQFQQHKYLHTFTIKKNNMKISWSFQLKMEMQMQLMEASHKLSKAIETNRKNLQTSNVYH